MHESFLHYIWQFQYFQNKELSTTEGQSITVFAPGMPNSDAGPDFSGARVRIDNIDWVGSVEIHTKANAWYDHGHNTDPAYNNVILHVVWQEDKPVLRADGEHMPTLVLQDRVDAALIHRYRQLLANPFLIPCEKDLPKVRQPVKLAMLEKAAIYRLERKADTLLQRLRATRNDWEEITYQLVAQNFGFNTNAEPFLQLARAVPLKTLLKHRDHIEQIEALLFGQAGLLEPPVTDDYLSLLQREHTVLARKYDMEQHKLATHMWKFMRLRPAGFPTLRIAQFAALICKTQSLFSKFITLETNKELADLFAVKTSGYWQQHYRFAVPARRAPAQLGKNSVDNLIINTVTPLLVSYGRLEDRQDLVDRALYFLQHISAEKNHITRKWQKMDVKIHSALESQGIIELNNNFCIKKKCLQCSIGVDILNPRS